jgi:hypothetical protein
MQIFAMIVGLDDFGLTAMIEPHETTATLFTKFEKQLVYLKMPHQFTAGYSIEHTRPGGFSDDGNDDPDYIGMQNGDPHVAAKYLTPAARLDPSKTMAATLAQASNQRPSRLRSRGRPSSLRMRSENGARKNRGRRVGREGARERSSAVDVASANDRSQHADRCERPPDLSTNHGAIDLAVAGVVLSPSGSKLPEHCAL